MMCSPASRELCMFYMDMYVCLDWNTYGYKFNLSLLINLFPGISKFKNVTPALCLDTHFSGLLYLKVFYTL